MKRSERIELFNRVRAKYSEFLTSVLWRLPGDRELFTEAMQYALLEKWQRIDKLGDGVFPDAISGEAYMKLLSELPAKIAPLEISVEEKTELGMKYARGMLFFQALNRQGAWCYTGKGIKLGDADKAVFWYQPQGSKTYRVIHGDLSVKDMAAEDLPK